MIVVMKRLPMVVAVVLGASLALPGPLDAAQDDPRLDALFTNLRVTGDEDEGRGWGARSWRSGSNRGASTSTTCWPRANA